MKNTDDLRQELMEAHDLDQFLSDNEENFINNSVCELLNLPHFTASSLTTSGSDFRLR